MSQSKIDINAVNYKPGGKQVIKEGSRKWIIKKFFWNCRHSGHLKVPILPGQIAHPVPAKRQKEHEWI
jgi:hypothetical protein